MMQAQSHDQQSIQLHSKRARALAVPSADELELISAIGKLAYYPDRFVRFIFPWNQVGTRLEGEDGPDVWQLEVLQDLGASLRAGKDLTEATATAIKLAVASGHGIGKSALVAWIIIWFASVFDFPAIVVTANTRTQLLTKTWRELAKWHRMSVNAHWFEWTATAFKHLAYPDSWFASAVPWSKHASEAFAGTHEKHVLMIFDEASAIDDTIWEVAEGAMSTPNAVWIAFGNPTKNTGYFSEVFGRLKHRWHTWQIDARTAKKANKEQIKQAIEDWGEDSDFVRVRWRGVFPRAGDMQLIRSDKVLEAMKRPAYPTADHARVMGLDVARHGSNQSATVRREGLNVLPVKRYRIPDTMKLAARFVEDIDEYDPDGVFIDATGMGWGVYDRIVQLRPKLVIIPVQVGDPATDEKLYYNLRAEIWWKMREFCHGQPSLPDDVELATDLTGIEYGYDARERVQVERKEDMKERGLASPDSGDALALTFTAVIQSRRPKSSTWRDKLRHRAGMDASPQAA